MPCIRQITPLAFAAWLLAAMPLAAHAESIGLSSSPILNPALESNVLARSAGNDRTTASMIARQLFARVEPVQIMKVVVDKAGDHRVAGLWLSGVKFHEPLTRRDFTNQVLSMIAETFTYSTVEEVDVRALVPIAVGKGSIVSGDNAVPTFREVFTVTALRDESTEAMRQRLDNNIGVFWEPWFTQQQLLPVTGNR